MGNCANCDHNYPTYFVKCPRCRCTRKRNEGTYATTQTSPPVTPLAQLFDSVMDFGCWAETSIASYLEM